MEKCVSLSVAMDSPDNTEDFAGRLLHQGDFNNFVITRGENLFNVKIYYGGDNDE